MTTWQFMQRAWDWEPSIPIGCALLLVGYLYVTHFRFTHRLLYFFLGDMVLLLSLVGPLDYLADHYLFSAHMLEHLILELVVPPLFLLAIPVELVDRLLNWRPAAAVERVLGHPAIAWILGIGTLWIWHFPAFYNAALANEHIHIFQHLSMLVTATIFWWPVLAPSGYRRLSAMPAIAYLYFAALANGTLGALLTFAPVGFYPMYVHPSDPLGALTLIRNGWGLNPDSDQQLGGLLMWVMGGSIFLWAVLVVFTRWFTGREGCRGATQVTEAVHA